MTGWRPPPAARPEPGDDPRHRLGELGEREVCAHYRRLGFRIVGRRVRTRAGEIDVLVRRRRLYVAVEVKTRRHHPAPERTVTPAQRERVCAALRSLAPALRPAPREFRVDIAAVTCRDPADATTWELRTFPGMPWPSG